MKPRCPAHLGRRFEDAIRVVGAVGTHVHGPCPLGIWLGQLDRRAHQQHGAVDATHHVFGDAADQTRHTSAGGCGHHHQRSAFEKYLAGDLVAHHGLDAAHDLALAHRHPAEAHLGGGLASDLAIGGFYDLEDVDVRTCHRRQSGSQLECDLAALAAVNRNQQPRIHGFSLRQGGSSA
ncbi:MAG: hypothetical protein R2770_04195 [Acidimicrobiales bacterium]